MAEEFLPLENTGDESTINNDVTSHREQVKHLLVGSPRAVERTIYSLHMQGYAEVNAWSRPVAAGSLGIIGEVVCILIRYVFVE